MVGVRYSFNLRGVIDLLIEAKRGTKMVCGWLEENIEAMRKRDKELGKLLAQLEAVKPRGINIDETRDSIIKEMSEINEERSKWEKLLEGWRIRDKDFKRLSVMLERTEGSGKMHPESYDLIDKYFGRNKYFGPGIVDKEEVELP